ncbi:MAG: cytochrome b/b6 domain-containing protein [Gammaproteobacteria bacterium]
MNPGVAPLRPLIPVWDLAVRLLHWSLVATVAAAWLTRHAVGGWHEWIGYATLAIVACRAVWGIVGSEYARFADFVRPVSVTVRYARAVFAGQEERFIGHNPLGGWMVLALLSMVVLVGVTGWLYTTDRFWGVPWVEELHSTLSDVMFIFVGLHILGVVFTSVRHRENLVAAMMRGRKRP